LKNLLDVKTLASAYSYSDYNRIAVWY